MHGQPSNGDYCYQAHDARVCSVICDFAGDGQSDRRDNARQAGRDTGPGTRREIPKKLRPPQNVVITRPVRSGQTVVAEGGDAQAKVKLENASQDIIVPLARPIQSGEKIALGLRPEHTSLVDDSPLKGTVTVVERLGSVSFAYVKVGDTTMTVQAEGSQVITPGSTVGIDLPANRLHMFGADETSVTAGTQ